MKQLLLITLVIFSCNQKKSATTNNPAETQSLKIDTLKVDVNLLSNMEKQLLNNIDTIASMIDAKSRLVRSVKSTVVQNNLETKIQYDGYSEIEGGVVNKIVSIGVNEKQKLVYVYYYVNGELLKSTSEIKDFDPFYSSIYFFNEKVYKPSELSLNSIKATKAQSELLLTQFR
jgi:hypothetical protein